MGRPKGSKNKPKAPLTAMVAVEAPKPVKEPRGAYERGDKLTLETIGIDKLGDCPVCGDNDWIQSELFKSVKICRACCSELTVVLRRRNLDMLQEHYKSLGDCRVVVPHPFQEEQS